HARSNPGRYCGHSVRRPPGADDRSTALANDRAAHAKRLDWSEGSGWLADGGYLARAPGTAGGDRDESGAPGAAGGMAEELSARRIVRRQWTARARAGRASAARHASHERESARQWRAAAAGAATARVPLVRRRGPRARRDHRGGNARAGWISSRPGAP